MKNDTNLMSETLTDNDDIRQLISIVDSDFRHYDEITFQESVKSIYSKWPLLNEVHQENQYNESQTHHSSKRKASA